MNAEGTAMNGFTAGQAFEGFVQDAERVGQSWANRAAENRAAREQQAESDRIQALIDQQASDIAGNLAEKYALRKALAKLDPNHPLIRNQLLQHKIQEVGVRAFWVNANYDDARKAGEDLVP